MSSYTGRAKINRVKWLVTRCDHFYTLTISYGAERKASRLSLSPAHRRLCGVTHPGGRGALPCRCIFNKEKTSFTWHLCTLLLFSLKENKLSFQESLAESSEQCFISFTSKIYSGPREGTGHKEISKKKKSKPSPCPPVRPGLGTGGGERGGGKHFSDKPNHFHVGMRKSGMPPSVLLKKVISCLILRSGRFIYVITAATCESCMQSSRNRSDTAIVLVSCSRHEDWLGMPGPFPSCLFIDNWQAVSWRPRPGLHLETI